MKPESQHCNYYYCGKEFIPTRRFVQKYCSSACCSLAYRERKNGYLGIRGINRDTKKFVTNANLAEALTEVAKQVKKELDSLNVKINSIKTNTTWILVGEAIIFLKLLMDGWALAKDDKLKEQQMAGFKKMVFSKMSKEDKEAFEAGAKGMGFDF
jgi:hypothetical protein